MGLEYIFKNFLINRCKGREILEGLIENFIPLPPEGQLGPPIKAVFAPSLINRLTHLQHMYTPARTKGTVACE